MIAGGSYVRFLDGPAASAIGAVAVLPFSNETGNAEADYLADGSTETLINTLARIPTLSVKARSAVTMYRDSKAPPAQLARELGVGALIYGRLVNQGEDVALIVSLVDATGGNQLWGDRYSGPLSGMGQVQRDLALGVEHALRTGLSAGERGKLAAGYTVDGDAYLLYLRGRHHSYSTTESGMRRAIDYYQQAIRIDPGFAQAHAGMAEAYRALAIVGQVPSMEAFPQARAAATHALELDDRLPEAHVALGWILFSFDWDWAGAEQQLKGAIALNPQSPDAHRAYAHLLSNQGRHDEALVEIVRARELDPRSAIINVMEGQMLFYAGRLDAAETRYRKTLEIAPEFWPAHQGIGRVQIARGALVDAIGTLRRSVSLSSNAVEPLTQLGYALAASGDRDGAHALLRQLETRSATSYVPAYAFAMIHNGLGDGQDALRYLEQSVAQREVQATFIKIDTRWDRLRSQGRFAALVKQLRLD
jgi:TolB-like protein/tetratricopeptide (TPR) repeat protein